MPSAVTLAVSVSSGISKHILSTENYSLVVFAVQVKDDGTSGKAEIWDVLRPKARETGTITKVWNASRKAASIPTLRHIDSRAFLEWDKARAAELQRANAFTNPNNLDSGVLAEYSTILEQTIPALDTFRDGMSYLIMGVKAIDEGQRLVVDRVVDPGIEPDPKLAAYYAEQEAQAKKWRDAAVFIREWFEFALKDPSRSEGFINPDARLAFWEKTGIYEKFHGREIEYINEKVIPAIAASMVTSNVEGLMDLWRALNRINTGSNTAMMDVETSHYQPVGSEPNLDQIIRGKSTDEIKEMYNGSTLSLGLLYLAAGFDHSGTGEYGSQQGLLSTFFETALIPKKEIPEEKLPPPPPGEPDSYESFRWSYKITK